MIEVGVMTVVYSAQASVAAGPAIPRAPSVGEMPRSRVHGWPMRGPSVRTDFTRPAGFDGFSSQYCCGRFSVVPKNRAAWLPAPVRSCSHADTVTVLRPSKRPVGSSTYAAFDPAAPPGSDSASPSSEKPVPRTVAS